MTEQQITNYYEGRCFVGNEHEENFKLVLAACKSINSDLDKLRKIHPMNRTQKEINRIDNLSFELQELMSLYSITYKQLLRN